MWNKPEIQAVGYPHNIRATPTPRMSHTSGHYCNSQGLQLGKSINDGFSSISCIMPFRTMKSSQRGRAGELPGQYHLISPCPMSNMSSLIESVWFALSLKNITPLQWLWAVRSPSDKPPDPVQPFPRSPGEARG